MSEKDLKEQFIIKEFRKELLKKFTNECQVFGKQISNLFGGKKINIEIEQWTEESMPDYHYIHANFDIPGYLGLLSATWDPRRKILDRNVVRIDESVRGQGYGKKINNLTEAWARNLGAEKLEISSIVNLKWKDSLIQKQGFIQDKREDSVYKDLLSNNKFIELS